MIPENHLLRLIDRYVDFGFIRERLRPFYSEIERPSVDPEVLLRILLIGYLYGVNSKPRLIEEITMHLAYRWFTGVGFDQAIPDHRVASAVPPGIPRARPERQPVAPTSRQIAAVSLMS